MHVFQQRIMPFYNAPQSSIMSQSTTMMGVPHTSFATADPTSMLGYPTMPYTAPMYAPNNAQYAPLTPPTFMPNMMETVAVRVPSGIVGALIGAKGQHIRTVLKQTRAQIRIEPPPQSTVDNEGGDAAAAASQAAANTERQVTIVGNAEQQCMAQHWLFQRIAQYDNNGDDTRLTLELHVPSRLVGRIIGKQGMHVCLRVHACAHAPKCAQVRELQRATGATVKIPEETPAHAIDNHQQPPAEATSSGSDQGGDKSATTTVVNGSGDAVADVEPRAQSPTTVVRISGTFAAVQVRWLRTHAHTYTLTQAVQARLRHMVYQFTQLSPPMKLMSP